MPPNRPRLRSMPKPMPKTAPKPSSRPAPKPPSKVLFSLGGQAVTEAEAVRVAGVLGVLGATALLFLNPVTRQLASAGTSSFLPDIHLPFQSRWAEIEPLLQQSTGARYSWAGGHPPSRVVWPKGSPGERGGIGFDCSGYVLAVASRVKNPPFWAKKDLGSNDIFAAVGSPRNAGVGAKPGDLIFWGNYLLGPVVHVGFVVNSSMAVSAMGRGQSVNGDDASQIVRMHPWSGTGMRVIGTAPW